MPTTPRPTHAPATKAGSVPGVADRFRVLLIEDNQLTAWVIMNTLSAGYDVASFSSLDAAAHELAGSDVRFVICGSPIADHDPGVVIRLAEVPGRSVIALVSDPDIKFPKNIAVLVKPFELARLVALLPLGRLPAGAGKKTSLP